MTSPVYVRASTNTVVRVLRMVNSAINSDSTILCDVFYQSSQLAHSCWLYNCGFGWKHLKFYKEQDSILFGFMRDVLAYPLALLSLMTFILRAVHNSYFSYLYVYCICLLCCLSLFSSLFTLSLIYSYCITCPLLLCWSVSYNNEQN